MQVLARLGFTNIIHADFLEDFPRYIQTETGLGAVQLVVVPLEGFLLLFPVAVLPQPDLLQDTDQQLIHVVLDAARCLDELAVSGNR